MQETQEQRKEIEFFPLAKSIESILLPLLQVEFQSCHSHMQKFIVFFFEYSWFLFISDLLCCLNHFAISSLWHNKCI